MNYPGGKGGAGVAQTLINLMPPHSVYVEPFLGGAAVMRQKRPANLNVGIEQSTATLELAIRDLTQSAWILSDRTTSDLAIPAGIVNYGEFSGTIAVSDAGGLRDTLDTSGDDNRRPSSEPARLQMLQGDCIEWLKVNAEQLGSTALVYCDPPYVRSSRRSKRDLYSFEMSDEDHVELLNVLKQLNCMVMISGYWSDFYSWELAGWNSVTFQTVVRSGATATEWVWFNYPKPVELHDYRYLGKGFRERERIKRKAKRWTERLKRMPELERQALLWAVRETQ